MKIEGKKTSVGVAPQKVFAFLSNFDNYQQLMPEEITNWKSEKDICSFTVKGMADISLKFGKMESPGLLELVPEKSPFKFSLLIYLEPEVINEQKTQAHVDVDADLNPMLAMLAKKPLEELAETITSKLVKVFG